MKKKATIIGYSGHAYVVLDILKANDFTNISYCEQKEKEYNPFNLTYLGDERHRKTIALLRSGSVFMGIGDNIARAKTFNYLKAIHASTPFIQHPSAIISSTVVIGEGSVIMQGAVINVLSKIGCGVICNTSSVIEHECMIGDFVHIAPGAVLAGNVSIGDFTFIGANAVVKQGVVIGKKVIVGAGSVVLKDIPDGSKAYGNPSKHNAW